jgi:hypothetical protein
LLTATVVLLGAGLATGETLSAYQQTNGVDVIMDVPRHLVEFQAACDALTGLETATASQLFRSTVEPFGDCP